MDLKGMNWLVNLYQKFGAMCLEAEEAVGQETFQYVEDQVQMVGAGAKKLYSGFIQDLVNPTSTDPVKLTPDLYQNSCADFGVHKRPKASIKKNTTKIDKKITEDSKVIDGENIGYSSSFSGLHNAHGFRASSSVGLVRGAGLELCLQQNEYNGYCGRSNVVIKRKSRKNSHLPSEMSATVTSQLKNLRRVSPCCEISKNGEEACDQIASLSHSGIVKLKRSDTGQVEGIADSTVPMADVSIDTSASDINLPVESGAKKETGLECTSTSGEPDKPLAETSGIGKTCGVISPVEQISSGPQCSRSASEECLSPRGHCKLDVTQNENIITDSRSENVKQVYQSELGGTCILVGQGKFLEDKPSPEKKKIWRAFLSKRSRKREYEHLAVQHGGINAGSKQETIVGLMVKLPIDDDPDKSLPQGVCESEWELL